MGMGDLRASESKSSSKSSSKNSSKNSNLSVEQQKANNSQTWWNENNRLQGTPGYDPGNPDTWSKAQKDAHAANNALGGGGLETNYSGGTGQTVVKPVVQQLPTAQQLPTNTFDMSQVQSLLQKYNFPYEKSLQDLMAQPSAYKAPSESEMLTQAQQYADLQISPLLSAIQSNLDKERANQASARSSVEAAYAGVPARTQAMLEEARNKATESAIARGMGRSGVVDWQTTKLSAPVMQQATEAEQEKAAKLAEIANTLAAAESGAMKQQQEATSRRGTLESAKLSDLRQQSQQMELQEQQAKWGQALNLANMAQQSSQAQQNLLMQLLPILMYG